MMTLAIWIAAGLILLVVAALWLRHAARQRSLRAQGAVFTPQSAPGGHKPFTAKREEEGVDYAGTLAELSSWVREAKRDVQAPATPSKPRRPTRAARATAVAQMPLAFEDAAFVAAGRRVDRVVTIYVVAPTENEFIGSDLLSAFAIVDLRHGEMGIFHHYGTGHLYDRNPLFSVANILEPGTFPMAVMEGFTTPGLALFLCLPCRLDPGMVFELMLNTAQRLAERLQGEVLDDVREPLSAAGIEHLRRSLKQP
jgi:cell division protein ZipA